MNTRAYLEDMGRHDNSANQAEHDAAEVLADPDRSSNARIVIALHAIQCDVGATVAAYSSLASVTADREDFSVSRARGLRGEDARAAAERRHARRTEHALDEMVAPDIRDELARRLRLLAEARGIDLRSGLRRLYDLVRAERHVRSVRARLPHRREPLAALHERQITDLRAAGVLGGSR